MGMSLWAVAAIAGIIAPCHGHGHMTLPPSRNGGTLARAADCLHGECMWFSQPTHIPGEPTLNAAPLRTFNVDVSEGAHDYSRKNPWRSPGAASVIGSGCGRAGGGPVRSMNGGTAKEFNLTQDMDGADLPVGPRTVWRRGAEEEVAWAVNANHGGGYSYRLCAVGDATSGGPMEECFQRGSLSFGKEATSWLQWLNPTPGAAPHPLHQRGGDGGMASSRVPIARVTVSTGTHPAGSEWVRNPIPACRICPARFRQSGCDAADCAGCCATVPLPDHYRINASWWREQDCFAETAGNGLPGSCPLGQTQFAEPLPGLSSLWSSWLWCDAPATDHAAVARANGGGGVGDAPHDMPCSRDNAMMRLNIVDKVAVPAHLSPGNYTLSWRWDAEQTDQVWQNCADVTLV